MSYMHVHNTDGFTLWHLLAHCHFFTATNRGFGTEAIVSCLLVPRFIGVTHTHLQEEEEEEDKVEHGQNVKIHFTVLPG